MPLSNVYLRRSKRFSHVLARTIRSIFKQRRICKTLCPPTYYTFIHTFNSRPSLPQRGSNKQKRADLRQVSLALVVDEEQGLPLYSRCYEGNVTDVVALGASLSGMICQGLPPQAPARLTFILDKGN